MNKKILFFYAIIGLLGCSDPHSDSKESKKQSQYDSATVQLDFVKTYEGHISNKYDILLKITSNGGEIVGKYFYKTEGIDIQVKGKLDNQGILVLNEYDSKGNQTGLFKGTILNNTKIKGDWSKPNGTKVVEFELIESNSLYEALKSKVNDEKYEPISGQYDFEFNSAGVFFGSTEIDYLGNRKFKFQILTARESSCVGEVSGIATIDEYGVGRYSNNDCKLLTFKFSSEKLNIDESECGLHGMSCEFAGEYLKKK